MKDNDSILFVFGAARSGTTYLNKILDQWFGYGMGPEGTFIETFFKKLPRYGDLSNETALRYLVEDISRCQMLEIIRTRWHPGIRFDVSPDEIWKRLKGNTYSDVVEATLRAVADFQHKPRIGNKNPGYWRMLPILESLFPDRAKYIFIIRDGRDVYLSLQGVKWGRHSPYKAAKNWMEMVNKTSEFASIIGKDRFLLIRYEDILYRPGEFFEKIGEFLKIGISVDEKEKFMAQSERNPKQLNFEKWMSSMNDKKQYVFEAIAGNGLRNHGYKTRFEDPSVSYIQSNIYEIQEIFRLIYIYFYHKLNTFPFIRENN